MALDQSVCTELLEAFKTTDGVDLIRDAVRYVAEFVLALEHLPTEGGPLPTRRGTPMAQFDEAVQWGISQLDGVIDLDRARHVWQSSLKARDCPPGPRLGSR